MECPKGGRRLLGDRANKTGLYALEDVDLFNLLVIPGAAEFADEAMQSVYGDAIAYCNAGPCSWWTSRRTPTR